MTEAQALNLISKLEDVKLNNLERNVVETKGRVQAAALKLDEGWFQKMLRYVASGKVEDGVQAIKESYHFQGIPEDSLRGVAIDVHDVTMWELLKKLGCWNRSRRKSLMDAKAVVVHLFSGLHEKKALQRLEKDGYFVLSVDIQNGLDIRNDLLWALLFKLAASGRVTAVIGGPPCRTFSILRHRPPGPRPLRSRWQPYGLDDLEPEERRLVDQDTGYFCRLVFLHAASTAGRVLNKEEMREVGFFLEQPADPDEYLDEGHELHGRVPTFWATPLWLRYREEAQLWLVNFDQLPLGHPTIKPTGGGTNMEGARCLDGVKAWGKGPRLFKMTEEQWKAHVSRGHVPFRRDCLTCVAGAGVGRRHGRVEHPDAFVLAADTSGPLKSPGMDSHQRGAKRSMRYLFVARLRLPTAFLNEAGCPLKGELKEDDELKEEDGDPLADYEEEEGGPLFREPEEDLDCGRNDDRGRSCLY